MLLSAIHLSIGAPVPPAAVVPPAAADPPAEKRMFSPAECFGDQAGCSKRLEEHPADLVGGHTNAVILASVAGAVAGGGPITAGAAGLLANTVLANDEDPTPAAQEVLAKTEPWQHERPGQDQPWHEYEQPPEKFLDFGFTMAKTNVETNVPVTVGVGDKAAAGAFALAKGVGSEGARYSYGSYSTYYDANGEPAPTPLNAGGGAAAASEPAAAAAGSSMYVGGARLGFADDVGFAERAVPVETPPAEKRLGDGQLLMAGLNYMSGDEEAAKQIVAGKVGEVAAVNPLLSGLSGAVGGAGAAAPPQQQGGGGGYGGGGGGWGNADADGDGVPNYADAQPYGPPLAKGYGGQRYGRPGYAGPAQGWGGPGGPPGTGHSGPGGGAGWSGPRRPGSRPGGAAPVGFADDAPGRTGFADDEPGRGAAGGAPVTGDEYSDAMLGHVAHGDLGGIISTAAEQAKTDPAGIQASQRLDDKLSKYDWTGVGHASTQGYIGAAQMAQGVFGRA